MDSQYKTVVRQEKVENRMGKYNVSFPMIQSFFVYIESLKITFRMQQDDQNTFKNHNHPMIPQIAAKPSFPNSFHNPNPIEKRNLLHYGFNYILPSFWYQELLDLNHALTSLENIQLPSFDTYINFLHLFGLQNPTLSVFHTKKHFPKESALFGSDFLEQQHYISSSTLSFSKIKNSFDQNQNQWTVINPILWSFIETKYQLSLQNPDNLLSSIQQPLKNQQKSSQLPHYQQIPKITVFFTKDFIHQNGRCKGKQEIHSLNEDYVCFLFKNVKYTVPRIALKKQIQKQLTKMTAKPIYLSLIVDQQGRKGRFFRKTYVQGFFYENLPFKDLLKSLIEIESLKRADSTEKFYIYDQFGQKIGNKITTVVQLTQLFEKKNIIVCTSQLDEIMNYQITKKTGLVQLLDKDFNYPENQGEKSVQNKNSIISISTFFAKLSKEKQFLYLLKMFQKDPVQELKKPGSKTTGFRPYSRQAKQIKILSGTFYRSDESVKSERNENNRQSDEVRFLDSATTNFDTPAFDCENQSERANSQSNYQNVRLHKHSSYNRAERKKKSQNYLQKKKKNNYIVRGNGMKANHNVKNENESEEYKKRIKHTLFHSLWSLQDDPEGLEFLVENMRKVAKECIFNREELINPIFLKRQKNQSQQLGLSFQTKQRDRSSAKRRFRQSSKKKQKEQIQRKRQIAQLEISLHRIANEIQRFYEPQIDMEKGQGEQKRWQKNMLQKLMDDYEFKKDNQQIKTIIDNSQGPYSELEKQSFKIKYRGAEQTLQKHQLDRDQIKSLSDGLNPIEDNDETI